jgi:acyl-CoA synthetase (AMP-forming)/AMP-acid ligase II
MFASGEVAEGRQVAIVLKHSPELYYAFLGAILHGCIPSFMPHPSPRQDPQLYWRNHRDVFEQTAIGIAVTYPENAAELGARFPRLRVFTPSDARAAAQPPARAIDPSTTAFIQYSSGTTGLKKGVALSHAAVCEQIERYSAALELKADDVIVSWLPLYHDMGLIACFMLPLLTGVPLVSLDAFEWVVQPSLMLSAMAERRGTLAWLPNFALHHLVRTLPEDFDADLSHVRAFIDCSEPCYAHSLRLFAAALARLGVTERQLAVCYAMAEAVFAVTQTVTRPPRTLNLDAAELGLGRAAEWPPGAEGGREVLSVGRPISGAKIRIEGPDGEILADRQVGEVCIQASYMFSGYVARPDLNAARIRDGWYHSGDVGFAHDGELFLLGRNDDLLILNGRNVFAHDIEIAVNETVADIKPGRCIALGIESGETGSQELVLLAESDADAASHPQIVRAARAAIFEHFGFLPRAVKLVPAGWLVKTTSGKIARSSNQAKYLEAYGRS